MKWNIEVFKSKKRWYWRLVAMNGKILAHSEVYNTKASCIKTAMHIVTNLVSCKLVLPKRTPLKPDTLRKKRAA